MTCLVQKILESMVPRTRDVLTGKPTGREWSRGPAGARRAILDVFERIGDCDRRFRLTYAQGSDPHHEASQLVDRFPPSQDQAGHATPRQGKQEAERE